MLLPLPALSPISRGSARANSLLTGLVAAWKLDEASGTRVDSSGRGNNLTSNNGVTSGVGKIGTAATLAGGSSQYLSSTAIDLVMGGGTSFTIAGWVKFSAVDQWGICGRWAAGNIEFLLSVDPWGTWNWRTTTGTVSRVSPAPDITSWFFVVVGFDAGTGQSFLSLNNDARSTASATVVTKTATFMLGRNEQVGSGPTWFLTGLLDAWHVWRRALTTTECTTLWNGGNGREHPFA